MQRLLERVGDECLYVPEQAGRMGGSLLARLMSMASPPYQRHPIGTLPGVRSVLFALLLAVWLVPTADLHAAEVGGAPEDPAAQEEVESEFAEEWAEFYEEAPLEVYDPIEPFNRAMFWFNDKLYFYFLKPVARGYRVVPEPARVSVSNVFANLATPVRLVNALLQLKVKDAGRELGRFVINSTVGVAGLFDPAKKYAGWREKDEDFGQTLGAYGLGPGFYLVLPVLGPSNLRDGIGRVPDYFLDPLPYWLRFEELLVVKTYDRVSELSLDKDTYESIKKEALDPYLFVRDAYAQNREGKIKK